MATVKNELGRALRYVSVASGNTAIVDLRATAGDAFPNAFVIYLNGGTATYQPCDYLGVVVPGSSSANAVNGTLVAAEWPFYSIAASSAACVVAAVQATSAELQMTGAISGLTSATPGIAVATYPIASEVHIGEVGGKLIFGSDSFDALAAGDYAANDVIAADANTTATTPLRGITVARVNGGAGYLVFAKLTNEVAAWAAGVRMDLYNVAAPTTALTGDNVASAPKFANDGEYVGSIEFSVLATPTGSDLRRQVRDDIRIPFKCAVADTKVYYRLVVLANEANETAGMQWNATLGAEAY